jgi:hypothetical protein
VSNVRLSTMLCLKGGLLNLGVRALYIKVFGMLNSFGPEFKIETRVFKDQCGFAIEGLTKALCRAIYLGRVWLSKFQVNSILK